MTLYRQQIFSDLLPVNGQGFRRASDTTISNLLGTTVGLSHSMTPVNDFCNQPVVSAVVQLVRSSSNFLFL